MHTAQRSLRLIYLLGNVIHIDKVGDVALGGIGELTRKTTVALVALAVVGHSLGTLTADDVIDAIDKTGHIAYASLARG